MAKLLGRDLGMTLAELIGLDPKNVKRIVLVADASEIAKAYITSYVERRAVPVIKVSLRCPVSDEFRRDMDAWLLEMFGTRVAGRRAECRRYELVAAANG